MNNVPELLMTLSRDAVAIAIVEYLRVSDFISVGDNQMLNELKYGALWTVVDDLVIFMTSQQSHFLAGDYVFFVDNTFFNTVLYATLSRSGLAERVTQMVDPLIPLPNQAKEAVATSVLRLSGKFVAKLLIAMYGESIRPLQYINRISLLWANRP